MGVPNNQTIKQYKHWRAEVFMSCQSSVIRLVTGKDCCWDYIDGVAIYPVMSQGCIVLSSARHNLTLSNALLYSAQRF